MLMSLYTSADMGKDISITSNLVNRFWQFKSNFGIVFQGKSSGEVTDIKLMSLYLLNQWMNFGNLRVILEYFLKANPMARSLYTSADIIKDNQYFLNFQFSAGILAI